MHSKYMHPFFSSIIMNHFLWLTFSKQQSFNDDILGLPKVKVYLHNKQNINIIWRVNMFTLSLIRFKLRHVFCNVTAKILISNHLIATVTIFFHTKNPLSTFLSISYFYMRKNRCRLKYEFLIKR